MSLYAMRKAARDLVDKEAAKTCRAVIDVRGQYYCAGTRASGLRSIWKRRANCSRKPGPNGYCWQHSHHSTQQETKT